MIDVIVEKGAKRIFVSAVDWPGWSRSAKSEEDALATLLRYAPRYTEAIGSKFGFRPPADVASFRVVERLRGNATTDFGAPGVPAKVDDAEVAGGDLARLRALLITGWKAFDKGVDAARGKKLATGPRGGGRALTVIVDHVRDAERGYISALGYPFKPTARGRALVDATRTAAIDAIGASARGELPARGPRGGRRWKPRFFVRRDLWHILDHLWEIQDRVT